MGPNLLIKMSNNIKKGIKGFRVTEEKGFTLLFAVLVSILILSVGASIVNLSVKQIILSGSGRESQYAFYAANTGVECALFWLWNSPEDGLVFGINENSVITSQTDEIKCAWRGSGGERDIFDGLNSTNGYGFYNLPGLEVTESDDNSVTTEFYLGFDTNLPYCAHVIVKRLYDDSDPDNPIIKNQIDSYGYNTCDPDNPRRVERALRVGSVN